MSAGMRKDSIIYIAGHRGMVGSAFVRKLQEQGYTTLIAKTSKELDLRRQAEVDAFFEQERPEFVFLAAARVGGILANSTYRADFIYDNIMISANVISAAKRFGVKKLLNLGSSCIFPRLAPQPMKEDALLTGPLEPTNEPYAIAKIAAIKMCRYFNEQYGTNFISAMPTNLYGPNDNYDLDTSHVLPLLIFRSPNLGDVNAMNARRFADDPELVNEQCLTPRNPAKSLSNFSANLPVVSQKSSDASMSADISFSSKNRPA